MSVRALEARLTEIAGNVEKALKNGDWEKFASAAPDGLSKGIKGFESAKISKLCKRIETMHAAGRYNRDRAAAEKTVRAERRKNRPRTDTKVLLMRLGAAAFPTDEEGNPLPELRVSDPAIADTVEEMEERMQEEADRKELARLTSKLSRQPRANGIPRLKAHNVDKYIAAVSRQLAAGNITSSQANALNYSAQLLLAITKSMPPRPQRALEAPDAKKPSR